MIYNAIKNRLNKEIKEIKKLYQASIDGEVPSKFHTKCDNIPNTLIIIQSVGNRRFGGFTTQLWDTRSGYKDDKNAFLFSLDKKKIYPYKHDGKAIYCHLNFGPVFDKVITLYTRPLSKKDLWTNESSIESSYDFYGDNNALSEDGRLSRIQGVECEVFQIIFY